MPVQLKSSRVSVAGLTSVSESNIQSSGGGVSGNCIAGVSGNGIAGGGGGGGGSSTGGLKNSVASTAAMFETNSVENNSSGLFRVT